LTIPKDLLLKIKRTCAVEAKKVLDSRFPILVTLGKKRDKKIFKFTVFGVQLPALLIEVLITDCADYTEGIGFWV
jgi:hypothetical protein